jgi:tricorn protease-like protein
MYADQIIGVPPKKEMQNVVLILQIKATEGLRDENKAHLINYLKATNKEVGLLFNFGKKPDFKRVVFSNERKEISEIDLKSVRIRVIRGIRVPSSG